MSENPNPTRCGRCGTDNPPGEDFCISCGAPLTLAADAVALAETSEGEDEPRSYEPEGVDKAPPTVLMGGFGGAPVPVPTETLMPNIDEPSQQER